MGVISAASFSAGGTCSAGGDCAELTSASFAFARLEDWTGDGGARGEGEGGAPGVSDSGADPHRP